jgi:DNA-binding MurR/RpiR family transcriptional regulator
MVNNTPKCLVKLKSKYNSLNPATKKVADYILTNPLDVIENNITDLASKIKVSQYSIINCLKTIGYKGYKDFRLSLAKEFEPSEMTLFEGITENDTPFEILCKTAQKKMQCLKDTTKLINEESLNNAIKLITSAKRIEIYGIGYSYFAASMLEMNLRRLGFDSIAFRDPNYQMMCASVLNSKDLAIGFSTSGESASIVKSLQLAKKNNTNTIAVTAFPDSPICRFADVVLLTTYSEPEILKNTNNSIVEQTLLVSSLTLAIALTNTRSAISRLNKTASVI